MDGADGTELPPLVGPARRVRRGARAVQALLGQIEAAMERGSAAHTQHLNNHVAAQLRQQSEYRMYVMAVDALHFRQRLAREEAGALATRLRRVLNRAYGDGYQIYSMLVPSPHFPAYAATEPDREYSLDALEEMAQEMRLCAQQEAGEAPAQTEAASPLQRCLAHSQDHLRSYHALLRQTAEDLMLMHAREVDHLHRQARALAQLLDVPGSPSEPGAAAEPEPGAP